MNSIQQKLFQYAETPPPSVWESIAEALEDGPAYAKKLHAFEATPPAAIWEMIALGLAAQPQAKVVSLRTKVFKYAIAIAVLGAIAAGSIFYLTNSASPKLANQIQPGATATQTPNNFLHTQSQSGTVSHDDEAATAISNEIPAPAVVHFSSRLALSKKQLVARELALVPEEKNIINTALPDRYMIATLANGKAVRLPKKAYSDYACAESYKNWWCKQRIASIQSKMAASVSTDFTDFMDLLKKLQDTQ